MLDYYKMNPLHLLLASMDVDTSNSIALAPQIETEALPLRQMSAPLVIGVDLGGTQTRAAVVRDGAIVARVSHSTPAAEGPAAVIAGIIAAIHEVMEQAEIGLSDIRGIGLGAPGPLDSRTGVVFEPPNLHGWHDVPLGDELRRSFAVRVAIGNDANLAGLAEYRYGAGRGTSDMIFMTVSTGIGGGIIIDGKIVEGVTGTAGEVGHMVIDMRPDAPRDNLGHIGCLEALASGTAIARDANALIASGRGQGIMAAHRELAARDPAAERLATSEALPGTGITEVSARDVSEAAKRGDAEAVALMRGAAVAIGVGCANLVNIFNPEAIIIGGGVSKAGDLLFEPVREAMRQRAFARPANAVRITPAQLGDDMGLIGAAAFVDYQATIGG